MKTRVITTVLISMLMLASACVFGGKPQGTMMFRTLNGLVEIPVKVEEAPDSLPAVVKVAMTQHAEDMHSLVHVQFDLSLISKPEPDADDVAINTCKIFEELRNCEYTRR